MTERKTRPELARSVLPTCLKTEFVVTANLREWCLFLRQRYYGLTGKPHPQMLEISTLIQKELREKSPDVFELLDREIKSKTLFDSVLEAARQLSSATTMDVLDALRNDLSFAPGMAANIVGFAAQVVEKVGQLDRYLKGDADVA